MEEKIIYVKPTKESFKEKATRKYREVRDWCGQNKEFVFAMTPVLVSGTIKIIGMVAKQKRVSEEQYLKERMIYDRSKGHYIETRRKMKSYEWEEFDRRRDNGETPSYILRDMGLLKR